MTRFLGRWASTYTMGCAHLKGSQLSFPPLTMEVLSTPGPSNPPSPSTSTPTEALRKIESFNGSNCNDNVPVAAPPHISGWRAYLMIGAISGSTFLNVCRSLRSKANTSILNYNPGVLQRRGDSRDSFHRERPKVYPGRHGVASSRI